MGARFVILDQMDAVVYLSIIWKQMFGRISRSVMKTRKNGHKQERIEQRIDLITHKSDMDVNKKRIGILTGGLGLMVVEVKQFGVFVC